MSTEQPIRIWGIAALQPSQKAVIDAHCFGDCGKISIGGIINDDHTGGLYVCPEPVCPYTEKEIENYGETMSFDQRHVVTLRWLKEPA